LVTKFCQYLNIINGEFIMAFIKHGEGKILTVIKTDKLTDQESKQLDDLTKKAKKFIKPSLPKEDKK